MTTDEIEMSGLHDVTGAVTRLAEVASADSIVGPIQEQEGRIVIPLAAVSASYGLGLGYGRGDSGEDGGDADSGEGGGGGGGGQGSARPVAVVEVTAEKLRVHQVVDSTRITLASLLLAAWSVFWIARTVRAFSKR